MYEIPTAYFSMAILRPVTYSCQTKPPSCGLLHPNDLPKFGHWGHWDLPIQSFINCSSWVLPLCSSKFRIFKIEKYPYRWVIFNKGISKLTFWLPNKKNNFFITHPRQYLIIYIKKLLLRLISPGYFMLAEKYYYVGGRL